MEKMLGDKENRLNSHPSPAGSQRRSCLAQGWTCPELSCWVRGWGSPGHPQSQTACPASLTGTRHSDVLAVLVTMGVGGGGYRCPLLLMGKTPYLLEAEVPVIDVLLFSIRL